MPFSFDRTGFPLVAVPGLQMQVHLLPVTKVQFERFLAEPSVYGDTWYEEVLALNPRVSYCRFTDKDRERIFLSGILADEALDFARWLGEDFDLPTVQEWRAIYAAFAAELAPARELLLQLAEGPARVILQRLLTQLQPRSLLDLTLMYRGVVEWVDRHGAWVGLGAPRPEFHHNLYNPFVDTVNPIHQKERVRYFGFRLVRRVE